MSNYELTDSVLAAIEEAQLKKESEDLLVIGDISGRVGVYEIGEGRLCEVYRFWERVDTFDLDEWGMLIAVGSECKASVFSLSKGMEEVYSHTGGLRVRQVKLVNDAGMNPTLIVSEGEGVMTVINMKEEKATRAKAPDTVSCFCALNTKTGIEIAFATRQGVIGWYNSNDTSKMSTTDPIGFALSDAGKATRRLWIVPELRLIVSVHSNTICLYERDQHNCLCIYKSLALNCEVQATELLNNVHLVYSVQGTGKLSVVAASSLEPVTTIETGLPK